MADEQKEVTFMRKHPEPVLAFKWDGRPMMHVSHQGEHDELCIPQWAKDQGANNNFVIESHGSPECKLCIRSSSSTAKPGDVIFKEDGNYYAMTENQFKEEFEVCAKPVAVKKAAATTDEKPHIVTDKGHHGPTAHCCSLEGPGTEKYKGQKFTSKQAEELLEEINKSKPI